MRDIFIHRHHTECRIGVTTDLYTPGRAGEVSSRPPLTWPCMAIAMHGIFHALSGSATSGALQGAYRLRATTIYPKISARTYLHERARAILRAMLKLLRNRITALAMALVLAVSLTPGMVNAAPSAGKSSMAEHMDMPMDGMMHCDQDMPSQDHQMPCDDGSACLGMLGCAVAAMLSPAAVAPADFHVLESSWPPRAALDGLTQPPALPPPIA